MLKRTLLVFTLIFTLFNFSIGKKLDQNWKSLFDTSYYSSYKNRPILKNYWLELSTTSNVVDLQELSYGIDALTAMYVSTSEIKYLEDAIILINNVKDRAEVTSEIESSRYYLRDHYKGWINNDPKRKSESTYLNETHLSEGYFYRYVSHLLRIINQDEILSNNKKVKEFYNSNLNFLIEHVWSKWYERGKRVGKCDQFLKDGRTHMASHWSFIAINLYVIDGDDERKKQYSEVFEWYNQKLRYNFKKHPQARKTWSWNSTWDSGWNVSGIYCEPFVEKAEVQDVAHGNHVIAYIVEANELGKGWNNSDIKKLNKLLICFLWNKKSGTFYDNVDGSVLKKGSKGNFQSEGFVKLGRYSKNTQKIYYKFINKSNEHHYSAQHGQLFANLLLNKYLFDKF